MRKTWYDEKNQVPDIQSIMLRKALVIDVFKVYENMYK